ncbi:M3 family oligoendopeptidase [Paenisporosarcina quisquiliarum]|uniref:M3 family oligoendopeptidase n=1 Tax=Paenisporosarcina quisquiliarum TaxID=365346 RepID=UPI0037360BD0
MDTIFLKNTFNELLIAFKNAKTFEEQNNFFKELNKHRLLYEGTKNLRMLNHFSDLNNVNAEEEYTTIQQSESLYLSLVNDYYETILSATYRDDLEKMWGEQLFKLAEIKIKTFNNEVAEEIEKENKLILEYQQIFRKAESVFRGESISLSSLIPYIFSSDRNTRKEAFESKYLFFQKNEKEFDRILDELVKVRHQMALKLGYPSYIELGYHRMHRTNLNQGDFKKYRKQVKEVGVPLVNDLRHKQKERLQVEKLKYYDEHVYFQTPAPKPVGGYQQILTTYLHVFDELSPETSTFYNEIMRNGHLDVQNRPEKTGGAFATYIGQEVAPYLYCNFNGTSNDVRVFAHEAGHAFQFYMTREKQIHEYIIPFDSAELFSFIMERLVWPWMEQFFGDEVIRYKYEHLTQGIMYMPIASVVDEFEHFLYQYPKATTLERKQQWRKLEQEYMPEKDYDQNEFLERGMGFCEYGHIFSTPFYFIDYDLAHFCSLQMWMKQQKEGVPPVQSFISMCESGGSLSFEDLLARANLMSPFEEGSLTTILEEVQVWLNNVDHHNF